MAKLSVYTSKGTKTTAVNMPKDWVEKKNLSLLAQAVRVYVDRGHPGLSKVKTRGEVSHSTRKIYRQKGTGQARHGDRGAPIFVGGGIAHGPKGVKRVLRLSRKMKAKALKIALSLKVKDGRVFLLSDLSKLTRTKDAASLLDKIGGKEANIDESSRFTLALSEKNKDMRLVFRNIEGVDVLPFKSLNAYMVHNAGVLLVDKEALNEKGAAGVKESNARGKVEKSGSRTKKPKGRLTREKKKA